MAPLQNLMQDDAVEEAAETEPKQDPGRKRKACTVECAIRPRSEAVRDRKRPG